MSWGFGAAAQPATGGFGAPASAPATGGFGAPATSAPSTGFGGGAGGFGAAAKPATGGFGAAPTAGTALSGFGGAAPAPATSGFGTPAAGSSSLWGGGGGGFGAASKPVGTGFGGGGFGGGGFGGAAAQPQQPAMPTAQQYPYKGIKGPGNATSWSQTADFSQINDTTPFESLPPSLQQHLLELRTFMHAERGAMQAVAASLNETDAGGGTYKGLGKRLTQLKSGRNAVEALGVRCGRRDRDADNFAKSLDAFEAEIRQYQHDVWEPLREEGDATSAKARSWSRVGSRARPAGPGRHHLQPAQQPFVALVAQLQEQMERLERQLRELEFDLMPGATDGLLGAPANADALVAAHTSLMSGSRLQSNGMTSGVRALGGGADSAGGLFVATSDASTTVGEAAAQINVALSNELTVLMNLSQWVARLHSRSDTARDLFARNYGQAEADVLFAPTRMTTGHYAMPPRGVVGGVGGAFTVPFELPPLPAQPPAPAGGFGTTTTLGSTGFGATAATGFGAAKPAAGFGAAPATAPAPTGGFGATPAAAAAAATTATATATTTGFGAAAPATTTTTGAAAAAPSAGFGFGGAAPASATASATTAVPASTAAGAGTGFGFGAPASSAAPAGGAAAGLGMGPGSPRFGPKRTGDDAGDDARPDMRRRP